MTPRKPWAILVPAVSLPGLIGGCAATRGVEDDDGGMDNGNGNETIKPIVYTALHN